MAKPDTFSGAEPDKIEQEVIRVVSAIPDDPANWVDPRSRVSRFFLGSSKAADIDREIKERWTKEIVIRLVKVGRRLGYKVNDSHSVTCWRENWMYDIVWRDLREGDYPETRSLPLVLECSWHHSDSGYAEVDALNRLMLARAQHRVMVCQGKWGFAAAFERLASTVDGSEITQAGDRYLLLSFDPNTKKFCSRIYVGRSADWDSIAGF